MARLADLTSRQAVLSALAEFDRLGRDAFLKKFGFARARNYFLSHHGKTYDSKAIVGVAYGYEHPAEGPLKAEDFSGGEATVKAVLERLGFEVVKANRPTEVPDLEIGRAYSWEELGELFGFTPNYLARVGGMVPRPEMRALLLISVPGGAKSFDYGDYWEGDDLIYTGRGKEGDQVLEGANRDVAENRSSLLVFEPAGSRRLRFVGSATCPEYWEGRAEDDKGRMRRVYRFRLRFGEQPARRTTKAEQEAAGRKGTPRHRRPRKFSKKPPKKRAPGLPKATPTETLARQEKADQDHHSILRVLVARLESRRWTNIEEIPSAVDLWADPPDNRGRVIFEAKTISDSNEVHQVRAALAQLFEYRWRFGTGSEPLCLVTNRPISDQQVRFLEAMGICVIWVDGDRLRPSGPGARQILGDLLE